MKQRMKAYMVNIPKNIDLPIFNIVSYSSYEGWDFAHMAIEYICMFVREKVTFDLLFTLDTFAMRRLI